MATTKILYMKDCGTSYHGRHLKVALEYIMALDKTQQGRLIGSVNCIPGFAYEQMRQTKKEFGKIDKRQGYHFIISFKEDEVDADTAFAITERFVTEYLGERYETVYAVHDNTDHIHSHIVFNSVGFVDGRKYRYEKGDWAKYIQPITNQICKDYGISVIEIEGEKATEFKTWDDYKNGPFVWSDMIKRDLDACIIQADNFAEFEQLLCEKGYLLQHGKHFAVKPPGMKRFRRCKNLGEQYTEDSIKQRVKTENLSTYKQETFDEVEKVIYSKIPRGKRAKLTGMQKKYYAKLYRLGLLKSKPYSKAWQYKDEIRQMHKIQEQYLFLINHDIDSVAHLQEITRELEGRKKEISSQKSKAYRSKKKCEGLFEIALKLSKLEDEEKAYQNGDDFFEEEHEQWEQFRMQLQEQGYSYDEVINLKIHYDGEIARLRNLAKEVSKELRIAQSLVQELTEEEKELEIGKGKEKDKEKERVQPQR